MDIAQTNVQLYNQVRLQGYSQEELRLIRRAYDLARKLYSGFFQADGVPFLAHVVGVASIVARLDMAADYVAAGCLHNVYTNGDFGDGVYRSTAYHRRRLVIDAVGERVEAHIFRFYEWLRRPQDAALRHAEYADRLEAQDRLLLTMHLADLLEKCHDCGPLYYGDDRWFADMVKQDGARYVDLAERLGYPQLATALSQGFGALLEASIPDSLRPQNSTQKYGRMEMPPSCTRKPTVKGRRVLRRLRRRIRRVSGVDPRT